MGLDNVAVGVNIAGECLDKVADKLPNAVDVIDKKIAKKIEKKSRIDDVKNAFLGAGEILKDVQEGMPKANEKVDEVAAVAIEEVGRELIENIKRKLKKTHGSKVKFGKFCECPIVYAGTKSGIVVDKINCDKLIYLTPENVKACNFVEKKYKRHKLGNDYYYEITFVDGSESFIRVSERHKNNIDSLSEKINCLE